MTETKSLQDLITEKGIKMTVRYGAPNNENMRDMDGWTITLRYQGRQMTVPFYMGYGHNGAEPKVSDVLDSLLSDSTGYDNACGFEDWASEYGYDTDSRKAEKIYKAVARNAVRLQKLLGDDYETLACAER